ncbi:MAG: PEGA domain-containing protein [Planctomycetota bacterium]
MIRRSPFVALVVVALASCVSLRKPRAVALSSDPPGARVRIDGRDCGFVTPCWISLDPDEEYRVAFEYPGYATAERLLTSRRQTEVILWKDQLVSTRVWLFPLWLNLEDFVTPIKTAKVSEPGRVYVRLERAEAQ